jgi:hypothetical protein
MDLYNTSIAVLYRKFEDQANCKLIKSRLNNPSKDFSFQKISQFVPTFDLSDKSQIVINGQKASN